MSTGCFGKLPIHPDFIHHNAVGSEIETLYKWFQEGLEKVRQEWGTNWKSEYRNAPPTRFLYRENDDKNILAGVWISAANTEGTPHPFLIWTSIPESLVEDRSLLLPLALWDFLRKAEELAIGGWNGTTLESFLVQVDNLSCSLDLSSASEKYRTYLKRKMANDVWSSIFGSFDDERKYLIIHNLVTLLGKKDCDKPALPLRFPLAPATIASFWINLAFQMTKQTSLPTLTSWNSNSLSLLFQELDGKHFLPMIRPDLAEKLGFDLAKSGRNDAEYVQEARKNYSAILNEPGLSLTVLLERFAQVAIQAESPTASEPEPRTQTDPIPVSVKAPAQIPEPALKPFSRPEPPAQIPEPALKPFSRPEPPAQIPEPALRPFSQPVPNPVLKPVSPGAPQPVPPAASEASSSDDGKDIHIAPRSEGLLKHSRYPHGCYGKLPIFGDFIKDRNNLPEIRSMDMWFQAGILAARQSNRNWDMEFTSAPSSRFLYASPDSRNLVAGVWTASVDKAGRRYPFLIYTLAPTAELGSHPQLYPLFFSDFFHRAQDLAENGWKGSDLKSLGNKVEQLTYHKDFDAGRVEYEKYLTQNKAGDLWKQLFGTEDSPSTMLLPTNLQSSLLPLRTGSASGMKTALRFPRMTGVEPSLWIDLTMRMSGRTSHPTLVCWTDQSLTILYPNLSSKFYACLMQPTVQTDSVADLAKIGGDNTGSLQRARERFGAVTAKLELTLGQLLRGITGR